MKKLAILGASGHGKVVADTALVSGWEEVVFFDDAWPGVTLNGNWNVVGDTANLLQRLADFSGVIIAIGDCAIRWNKQQKIDEAGGQLATIIHPMAFISPNSRVGKGVAIMANAVINTNATVGDCCIVNSGAIVEHDCQLGQAVHLCPGAVLSGDVSIGDYCWIGVGAVVRQGIQICAGVTVGTGAVVVKPVLESQTVVGCPAAPLG